MQKLFILFALTLTTSVLAGDVTPEKIEACKAANFQSAEYINDCVGSNANVE